MKKAKKLSLAILSLVCALALFVAVFAGCGGDPTTPTTPGGGGETPTPVNVSLVAPDGAPMAALADMWGSEFDGATIDYRVDYPRGSRQRAVFRVTDRGDLRALKFRAGPFDCETVTVNGQKCPTELSGDARWAWVTIDALEDGREYTVDIR